MRARSYQSICRAMLRGTGMTDVFISYKREDQSTAERLKSALEQEGWQVWWDQEIYAGEKWGDKLFEELGKAKTVAVLWSRRTSTRALEPSLVASARTLGTGHCQGNGQSNRFHRPRVR